MEPLGAVVSDRELHDAEHEEDQQRQDERELNRRGPSLTIFESAVHRRGDDGTDGPGEPVRHPSTYGRASEMVVNASFTWPPRVATIPTMTAAISATSMPYSTAVAPRSSRERS